MEQKQSMKKITISDDSYWKLLEIKVKLKCRTWKETIYELHKLVFGNGPQDVKRP
jgi:predicted CopG family antitoxin